MRKDDTYAKPLRGRTPEAIRRQTDERGKDGRLRMCTRRRQLGWALTSPPNVRYGSQADIPRYTHLCPLLGAKRSPPVAEAVAASFLRALGLIAGLQVLGPRAGGGEDKSQGDGGK